jgi:hypothetical protein
LLGMVFARLYELGPIIVEGAIRRFDQFTRRKIE